MLKTTDLNGVKETALSFLNIDIKETPVSPIVVDHPIFESGIIALKSEVINILTPDGLKKVKDSYTEKIKNSKDLFSVYIIIRKAYRLTFLKYVKSYLSIEDFSELLADAWVSSENPNQDVNCSLSLLTRWFKESDKQILMNEEDYEVYCNLPDQFQIYRGVAVGRNPKGLSWTPNYEKAVWFSKRFDREDKKGYVQAATVKKEKVLAYFNTRGEDEIVVNTRDLIGIEII